MSDLRYLTAAEALRARDALSAEIDELSRRIADDVERRRRLREDRARVARLVFEPPTGERRGGASDDLLVPVGHLVGPVREWLAEFGPGGRRTLSELSRVSVRTIRAMLNEGDSRHREHVTLETADRLLTAVGQGWQIGSVPVVTRDQAIWRGRRGRPSLEDWVDRDDHGCSE